MRDSRGFTLLEVLLVVTIISVIATLTIPSLIRSMDRSRQSATVADLRAIGSALERYAVEHGAYPAVDDLAALDGALVPEYLKQLPVRDAWGHPLVLEVGEAGATYTLRSPGKDGRLQEAPLAEIAHDPAADIVVADGVFVQRPAGGGQNEDGEAPEAPAGGLSED